MTNNNLIIELGLDGSASDLVADAGRHLEAEPLRRCIDSSQKNIARAGRFKYVPLAIAFLMLSLLAAGVFGLLFTHHVVGGVAIALAIAALVAMVLVDPQAIVRHVDAMEAFTHTLRQQWESHVGHRTAAPCETTRQWLRRTLPMAGVAGVRDALSGALNRAVATDIELGELRGRALGQRQAAEQAGQALRMQLRHAASGWRGRCHAHRVRRPAHAIVNVIERREGAERLIMATDAARLALQAIIEALRAAIVTADDRLANPAERLNSNSLKTIAELRALDARTLAGKLLPPADSIASAARQMVKRELQGILRRLADRPPDEPVEASIKEEVRQVLSATDVMPSGLQTCLDGNSSQPLISQIDAEAGEFSISRVTPGRVQRRVRWVMCEGGAASPLFDAIRRSSPGCTVRAVEHDDPDELIAVTECRYEPGQEIVEFGDAARALDAVDADLKAAMITAVDDDDLILKSTAECGDDPNRPARHLTLGLAYGKIVRDGGECYRFANGLRLQGRNGAVIAQGFDEAVEVIRTDPRLADLLAVAITNHEAAQGATTVMRAIEQVMNKSDFVPSAHRNRVRALLAEERDRLRPLIEEPA